MSDAKLHRLPNGDWINPAEVTGIRISYTRPDDASASVIVDTARLLGASIVYFPDEGRARQWSAEFAAVCNVSEPPQ